MRQALPGGHNQPWQLQAKLIHRSDINPAPSAPPNRSSTPYPLLAWQTLAQTLINPAGVAWMQFLLAHARVCLG